MLLIRGNIKAVEESLYHALIFTFKNERQLMPLSHQGAGNHKVQISQLSDINIFRGQFLPTPPPHGIAQPSRDM